ncbi:TonB-dependent receptor [Cellvibrio sp. BR]|uniref:TonB-dependent receptor n=1 Tax=Cellvibrio sp. QJXJ TaxID=2964606 RepID=UPI0002601545|nr:TonB-dependent receptor [Cellvibrio sp. QJXJ]EIK46250.1 TonB-dependent receptor [Cellvibrio sp. BR]UUA71839.1 hypothetical protein NNX04_15615 [Cellvibrio sp. QJXJ]
MQDGRFDIIENNVFSSEKDYSQIDISMSYDLSDNVSIFLEGINVTEEGARIHGREQNHMFYVGEGVGRYALGVRASF